MDQLESLCVHTLSLPGMTVRNPEYLIILPLIQGSLKIAFGLKDSKTPFSILTSEVEDGPAVSGSTFTPKKMKDMTASGNKPAVQLRSPVCWLIVFRQ